MSQALAAVDLGAQRLQTQVLDIAGDAHRDDGAFGLDGLGLAARLEVDGDARGLHLGQRALHRQLHLTEQRRRVDGIDSNHRRCRSLPTTPKRRRRCFRCTEMRCGAT